MKTPLLNNCSILYKKIAERKIENIYLIHHWDTDGILSAVLIEKALNRFNNNLKFTYITPRIGEHSVKAFKTSITEGSALFVIDYGIPIKELENKYSNIDPNKTLIAVIDHHKNDVSSIKITKVCNPVAMGHSEDEYPSTTIVIKKLVDEKADDLLVSLGIIGDLGHRIINNKYYNWIMNVLSNNNYTLNNAIEITRLIDSCYKLIDNNCINHVVEILRHENLESFINNKKLQNNLLKIEKELKIIEENSKIYRENTLLVIENQTNLYITSEVGRKLAKDNPDKIIVFYNYIKPLNKVYIYVRSQKYPVGKLIPFLKKKGLNAGGKDYVFVVACQKNCLEKKDMITNTIKEKLLYK